MEKKKQKKRAFSAVASLEGQYFRLTKNFIDFSEQNLLDCTYGNIRSGCDGGYTHGIID
jgi:hypothetical protein